MLIALVLVGTRLLGPYLAHVYGGGRSPGDRAFLPLERALYRLGGIDPEREQRWHVARRSAVGCGGKRPCCNARPDTVPQ
ncbi:MAG: potassium-transporting ATPase subunit KdpA [Actinobacteria bacterium]|nr:potassium-transporting ATPase subunit KdpA [Actinomycetota bacterium]